MENDDETVRECASEEKCVPRQSAAHEDRHSHATACDIIVDRIDEIVVAEEQSVSCSFVAIANLDAVNFDSLLGACGCSARRLSTPDDDDFINTIIVNNTTTFIVVCDDDTIFVCECGPGVANSCCNGMRPMEQKEESNLFQKKKKNVKLFRFINELSQMVKKKHQKRQKNKQISLRYRG
jgi:hypothetical protein